MSKELPIKSDPRSLVNIVSDRLKEAILAIPEDIQAMPLEDLVKLTSKGEWSDTDLRLRDAFWREYDTAQSAYRNIRNENVYQGITASQNFYRLINDKVRLSFIVRPPTEYVAEANLLHTRLFERMLEISKMSPMENGKLNTKVAETQFKLFQYIDQRKHGAIIQRVEQKNLNVNVEASKPPTQEIPQNMDEIDRRLMELEQRALEFKQTVPQDIIIDAITLPQKDEEQEES
jgi:hypothetical protein